MGSLQQDNVVGHLFWARYYTRMFWLYRTHPVPVRPSWDHYAVSIKGSEQSWQMSLGDDPFLEESQILRDLKGAGRSHSRMVLAKTEKDECAVTESGVYWQILSRVEGLTSCLTHRQTAAQHVC